MIALLFLVIRLALVAMAVYAFVDAARRPATAFEVHGTLTKPIWLGITGVSALVIFWLGFLNLLGLPAIVAVIVYIVDVKPALSGTANPGS